MRKSPSPLHHHHHTHRNDMVSSLVIVGNNVPVGYTVPPFPSLHFPLGSQARAYHLSFLYSAADVWKFTLYWTLIFSFAFHMCAAVMAVVMHNRRLTGGLWIIPVYAAVAGLQSVASGTVVGFMVGAVYRAGLFGVSTWIPFAWGLLQILYLVISSYSMMSVVL